MRRHALSALQARWRDESEDRRTRPGARTTASRSQLWRDPSYCRRLEGDVERLAQGHRTHRCSETAALGPRSHWAREGADPRSVGQSRKTSTTDPGSHCPGEARVSRAGPGSPFHPWHRLVLGRGRKDPLQLHLHELGPPGDKDYGRVADTLRRHPSGTDCCQCPGASYLRGVWIRSILGTGDRPPIGAVPCSVLQTHTAPRQTKSVLHGLLPPRRQFIRALLEAARLAGRTGEVPGNCTPQPPSRRGDRWTC